MPDPAYFNPTVYGDLTGINYAVWLCSHLFADMKFMTLFSMLFGAGIVLLCGRVKERGASPTRVHYRRTFWLLLFGLMHAYLLWHGDILVWYSLSALLAYLFWRVRPGWLLFWSLLLLLVGTAVYSLAQWSITYWPEDAIANTSDYWAPSAEVISDRLETYRSGWTDQMFDRAMSSVMMHTFIYLIFGMWRTLGLMLLGMALMKWGVLSAQRSNRFYMIAMLIGLSLGLPVIYYGVSQHFAHDWSVKYSLYGGGLFNYWSSILVAGAYLSFVTLICKNGLIKRLQGWFGAVGRMAFTNYILQTFICTLIFYGNGFALFGYVPRWGQALITLGVWVVVILLSNIWLRRFKFGPLEWLWRTLTYSRRQPFRMSNSNSLAG